MKKLATSLVLIALGAVAIYVGHNRAGSVAGVSDKVGTQVANAFDGKARQPEYIWYYAGGGVLIGAGLFMALRKSNG